MIEDKKVTAWITWQLDFFEQEQDKFNLYIDQQEKCAIPIVMGFLRGGDSPNLP